MPTILPTKFFGLPALVGLAIISLYLGPWLVYGENAYVRIHDSLDVIMAWHTIMAREGFWFAPNGSLVGPILPEGAPRVSYPNELSLTTLLFKVLQPYWAYVTLQASLRILAYSGMFLFLISALPPFPLKRLAVLGGSLSYAVIPYYVWSGGSACAAWVAYALIKLWRGERVVLPLLILCAFPFVSSIVLTGMYVIAVSWILVFASFWFRRNTKPIALGAVLVTAVHLLVEYRLVLFAILPNFVPHRVEFEIGHLTFMDAAIQATRDILGVAPVVESLHRPLTLLLVIVCAAIILFRYAWWKASRNFGPFWLNGSEKCLWAILGLSLTICVTLSLAQAYWEWTGSQLLRDWIPLLTKLNISRGFYFHPFFWSVIFAVTLGVVGSVMPKRIATALVVGIITAQMAIAASQHEFWTERTQSGVTFSQFYSVPLFDEIATKLEINKRDKVVASIGIHPSVTQYNGFRTADAYLNLYPLAIKHRFRETVYPEFRKNDALLHYFDSFGSRMYFFSSQMGCPRNGAVCKMEDGQPLIDYAIDAASFRSYGVSFIFSAARIRNAQALGLRELGDFRHPGAAWALTVYGTEVSP